MPQLSRRRFLETAGLLATGLIFVPGSLLARARRAMKITDIEIHQVLPPYHDYNRAALFRYLGLGMQVRDFYIVKTDIGLEGYGEGPRGSMGKDRFAQYIGSDPFDWLADRENLPINMAAYDLMGKYLGLPVWKLLGQKVRSWVPVASWTVSQPPEAMAEEVVSVSRRGYRWMKYHVSSLQNVVAQTEAMQKVAPPGFRVHYDFNGDSNFEAVYPVLKELERFPVAGRIEDPIHSIDHAGYRILREKCRISILVHHAPLDFFALNNLCDGFMVGHAPVGFAMAMAALAESTNIPFMLQQGGGLINQAFLAHEAAVFRMATIDHVNVCHLWSDDLTVETMPVVGGSIEVPDGPGLGVTLDRAKLERYAAAPRPKQDRFLVRVQYANGLRVYFRFDPDADGGHLNLNPPYVPGPIISGYGNPVTTDFWDETGSPEFEKLWEKTQSGVVFTQDPP